MHCALFDCLQAADQLFTEMGWQLCSHNVYHQLDFMQ